MKKLFLMSALVAGTLTFSSCGVSNNLTDNRNLNETSVVLSQNNYKIVGQTTGEVTGRYIIGIGNFSKKALRNNAIDQMMKNANLHGSQALTNVTVRSSRRIITPLYVEVTMTATANIVEFTK